MEKLTAAQLAEKLNGCNRGDDMPEEFADIAKESGLVIVYGASDDLMEFEGAIREEYGGGTIRFNSKGKEWDEECKDAVELLLEKGFDVVSAIKLNSIEAIWHAKHDRGNGDEVCSWKYETEIPHEIFCM